MKENSVTSNSRKAIAGIDYSMTGPAMCVHEGEEWSVDNCNFLFLAKRKKYHGDFVCANGSTIQGLETYTGVGLDVERFSFQSAHFMAYLDMFERVDEVAIEGYAYGARGKVFNIGENTGILKYDIIREGYNLGVLQPGEVKKFATGKGNATKQMMYDAWYEETNINLGSLLDCIPDKGPVNDVVDSYYICKLAWFNKYVS